MDDEQRQDFRPPQGWGSTPRPDAVVGTSSAVGADVPKASGWREAAIAAEASFAPMADESEPAPEQVDDIAREPDLAATVRHLRAALIVVSVLLVVVVIGAFAPGPWNAREAAVEPTPSPMIVSSDQLQAPPTVADRYVVGYNSYLDDPVMGVMLLPNNQQMTLSSVSNDLDTFTLASGVVILLSSLNNPGATLADMPQAAATWARSNHVTLSTGMLNGQVPGNRTSGLGYEGWCAPGGEYNGMNGVGCFYPTSLGGVVAWVWAPSSVEPATVNVMLDNFVPVS